MITRNFRKTLHVSEPLFIGSEFVQIERRPNDDDGTPQVLILGPAEPGQPPRLRRKSWHARQGERVLLFDNVYLTVENASKQSRVNVLIEAPFSVKITSVNPTTVKAPPPPPVESQLFRRVQFDVPGSLYVSPMPGRRVPLSLAEEEIARCGIGRVVCLTSDEEIKKKSPAYAAALQAGVAWQQTAFPIPDYGVPADPAAFWAHTAAVAEALKAGERILLHCGAGIGRTGMYAVAVARQLGLPLTTAFQVVRRAKSEPERPEQVALVSGAMGA